MRSQMPATLACVFACLAVPGLAVAADDLAHARQDPTTGSGFGPALGEAALEQLRGGESTTGVTVRSDGRVEGNMADHIVSGHNGVDGGAFANAAGISTVIQNSGSNVLIQNGTSVNVRFAGSGP